MLRTIAVTLASSLLASVALAQNTTPTAPTAPTKPQVRDAARQVRDTATKTAQDAVTGKMTIVETAVAAGNFTTLASLLTAAGLVDTLNGAGPFTVFAPTDEAFAKLPKELLAELAKPENKERLKAILTYHVVPGKVTASEVVKVTFAPTVQGQRIDVKAAGGKVMVDGANVTKTDIMASNGVIHVIDSVILPVEMNTLEVARKAGRFKTLLAAIEAAGLNPMFEAPGTGFTVLAPTDEAFAKLPAGTVESLLKPENKNKLIEILTQHVIPGGRVYSDTVVGMSEARNAAGRAMPIMVKEKVVTIGGATVVAVDIESSNAVIHAIDTVILPAAAAGAKSTATATEKSSQN